MRLISILTLTMVASIPARGQTEPGFAVNFVAPNASSNLDGNTYSAVPIVSVSGSMRYQQVYAASEFTYLTNFEGGWFFGVYFRGDATNGTQAGVDIVSMQMNASTTLRGPDELSVVFSDNVGPDDTIVRMGGLNQLLIGGHGDGPEIWLFGIGSSKAPFLYNPARGNLLLDIRIFQGDRNTNGPFQPRFDACNQVGDTVSRVWATDVNASIGVVETIGLPSWLFFWPNPKLHIQQQPNSLDLWWPANPTSFVFQTSLKLGTQAQWLDITNGIVRTNAINTFTIPFESAGATAYFRLISTTPP